ncbi:hypothetical protein [Polluticoccus soli]|uniref:hypothetical protein n=1 Tax=Polluticoccus soli TaxID=3034150 RepID=UPI0023E31D44|nr:hypothetical protein [Flavipsychrobacter sp. JY13-12]
MKDGNAMKEELLARLIDETFSKIACPLEGNGMYEEIRKAVMDAYTLGTKTQEDIILETVIPTSA